VRGCLFVLVLAAVVLSVAAWFGSPLLASAVIASALQNAGYHAASSTVTATSNPPPRLLLGRADRVEIVGSDVAFRTFHAAGLDLVLTDVDIVGRTAGRISGRISGAGLQTADGQAASADVTVDGDAAAADATIVVDAVSVDRVVKATFQKQFGARVTATQLVAPDILRVAVGAVTLEGRLGVDASGAITISTPLGTATILSLDPTFPLRLRTIGVASGGLRIGATLDAETLLGG
jgi:hypothetical protein